MPQQRKFFPGWLVVASGFVIMATCYTIFVNCMSLFQPLIVSDLGISLAQYNISNAISTVVSVIGSLVIGHVADKVSGRVLGSLTVIATSAVLAGMSFVGELWQVYVLFAVSGSFASAWCVLLSCSYSCWPRSPSPPSCARALRGSRRPPLFSVRPVLPVAALEAEWMLVPSFGFQGGHGPTK